MTEIQILDKGFVRLDACDATDLSVVNAARVSFGAKSEELSDKDKGLIGFLMREKHGTPFEHNFFRFHIKAPIFVVREWFRHRIGWSYNEYSGRYSEIPQEAYMPAPEQMRTQVGKPGGYTFEQMEEWEAETARTAIKLGYFQAFNSYDLLLKKGVAKEIARLVIPVGAYTEFYATTNARALMNFINLRADSNAQWEIQQYANALEQIFEKQMPATHSHFVYNGRVAP
jgi:thymidylate synthase (FAD)